VEIAATTVTAIPASAAAIEPKAVLKPKSVPVHDTSINSDYADATGQDELQAAQDQGEKENFSNGFHG
jgi:hypothetical protein